MTIVEIPCSSWSDFRNVALPKVFGGNAFTRGRYRFRGHSSETFLLQSSFDRWYSKVGTKIPRIEAAQRLIDLFQEERFNSFDSPKAKENSEEILALAQHYGIPTRLLDWSESPYIAAFFAFANLTTVPNVDSRIAIWCLDTQNSVWTEDKGIRLLSIPSPYNERLKSQLGHFTLLQSPHDSIEDHIVACKPKGTVLWKITIPTTEGIAAISDLDFMGVNYSTIYHGIDGCARAAMIRMVLQQQKTTWRKTAVRRVKRRKVTPKRRNPSNLQP